MTVLGTEYGMRVHYLQHVPFEPPAAIADWAADRGHDLDGTHLWKRELLPAVETFDMLVVLGGPMGVGESDGYPWLPDERALISDSLDAETPVLGVCLGAQQLAAALGGAVAPHHTREVGWFPVETTGAAVHSPLAPLGEEFPAFHWHGDAFEVPPGGTLLASTPACRTQAFLAADGLALGLQFHLEATEESVRRLIEATDDLGDGAYVQDTDDLLADDAQFDALRAALDAVLDAFTAGV